MGYGVVVRRCSHGSWMIPHSCYFGDAAVDTSLLAEPANTLDIAPLMARAAIPSSGTASPLRVAILEHDDSLREQVLLPGLRRCGFEVETMRNTGELQRGLLNTEGFDLCVLDSVLSGGDGISLPQWLRTQYPQMGVVIFSSQTDPYDHLRSLMEGGDAYLPKPASVEIVAATLNSVARRMQHLSPRVPAGSATPASARMQWQLQSDGWCLIAPDGAQATLTISERRLVRMLWEHEGGLVTRDDLMRAVANGQCDVGEIDPHGLDVLLYRLRRKVQSRTGQVLPLEVVRGAGYILHRQIPHGNAE